MISGEAGVGKTRLAAAAREHGAVLLVEDVHAADEASLDYSLHAWIWKHNPSGMFAIWNPKVHCP